MFDSWSSNFVLPRPDHPSKDLNSRHVAPGMYAPRDVATARPYTAADFQHDAAVLRIEPDAETIAPPAPMEIGTYAGTYIAALPRELQSMLRCYWGSGILPVSYRVAGVIAGRPALVQHWEGMQLALEDGSRYAQAKNLSPTDRGAADSATMNATRTIHRGEVHAKASDADGRLVVTWGKRVISFDYPNVKHAEFIDLHGTLRFMSDDAKLVMCGLPDAPEVQPMGSYTDIASCGHRVHRYWKRYATSHDQFQAHNTRCHYMYELIRGEIARVAVVTYKQISSCRIFGIDAVGNILIAVYTNPQRGYLARMEPVWLPYYEGMAMPTELPKMTPYDLPFEAADYTYSPDGTIYAAYVRFTRIYVAMS